MKTFFEMCRVILSGAMKLNLSPELRRNPDHDWFMTRPSLITGFGLGCPWLHFWIYTKPVFTRPKTAQERLDHKVMCWMIACSAILFALMCAFM